MMPFDLTRWFRRRMLPLTVMTGLIVQLSVPLAYHVAKRNELWQEARHLAAQVGSLLRIEIELQPVLWRYSVPKLHERLAQEGVLLGHHVVIVAKDHRTLPLDSGNKPAWPIWGRSEVRMGHTVEAQVYVALDLTPLSRTTIWLAALSFVFSLLLSAVLYLLPVRAVSVAQRRIDRLLGKLTWTVQQQDRQRIARDLHDGAGQALTAARLSLLTLPGNLDLQTVGRLLDDALDEIRRSVDALSPPVLAEQGLSEALRRHCATIAAATGLTILCEVDPLPPLHPDLEIACFRMVQEALSNCAKHAQAQRVWVQMNHTETDVFLAIYDDGKLPHSPIREGHGLHSIRERARLLCGHAEIRSCADLGLRIEVHLPKDTDS